MESRFKFLRGPLCLNAGRVNVSECLVENHIVGHLETPTKKTDILTFLKIKDFLGEQLTSDNLSSLAIWQKMKESDFPTPPTQCSTDIF